MDLSTLIREIETRAVEVGGQTVTVRAIAAWECTRLMEVTRPPVPPNKPQLPAPLGVKIDPVPDESDPAYQAAVQRFYLRARIGRIIAATNHEHAGKSWAEMAGKPGEPAPGLEGWLNDAIDSLSRLPGPFLDVLHKAIVDLDENMTKAAAKN